MIHIGGNPLLTKDFEDIVYKKERIELNKDALNKVEVNYEFLQEYAKDKIIYGINTGLGPMAQYKISESEQLELQFNLIRSHSSGSGNYFSEDLSRATMLARLKLAHLALNLIGEGEVLYNGQLQPAIQVFNQQKIKPLTIHLREGLALMNGTSAMTGVAMVNIIHAKKAVETALILSSIANELMKSFDDHFSFELNHVKQHDGQSKVAESMRTLLSDSKLVRKRPDHLYHKKIEEAIFTDKVQEYYSLRCVPQIIGPIYDTLLQTEKVIINELNSANDNPVVDHLNKNVYHGGNFHGDYVSLEMDKLKIVISKLCMLSERQLNYLLNDRLNQKLPPFVNLGKLGLNFGMQGMQFTATSTTAENQTLSYPMYLHSISNNNDNQDIVSMGCNAALLTKRVIENTFDVLSIQAITLMQAIDYLQCHSRLSSFTHHFYNDMRSVMASFVDDKPKYKDLQEVKKHLLNRETNVIFRP